MKWGKREKGGIVAAKATILVVDDEANNRNLLVAQLGGDDYELLTAASGEEALALIDSRLPDLVLLDVMMPGISGFDVAEILKSEGRTAHIPIIMLTALGDSDSRLTALSNGAEEFLTKPVARAELRVRIHNLLKLKKYQDRLVEQVVSSSSELEHAHRQVNALQDQLLQSEKLAAIGQLAAGVAHEINNPVGFVNANLGTLKGYVKDMLRMLHAYEAGGGEASRDPAVDARLRQLRSELELDYLCDDAPLLIDESLEGLSRVCRIVQDLKSFAHADAYPESILTDLHECLDSTLNIAINEIKYKAQVVKDYGAIPEIECVPSQLNQVFLNLLVNAAQAMPENAHGTITVRTRCDASAILIEIADTGSGIAPDVLPRIFDPFFTTKPVGKGTGLGLSLSYGIVQRHGGRIEVDSVLGQGTTFRVVLPIQRPGVGIQSV